MTSQMHCDNIRMIVCALPTNQFDYISQKAYHLYDNELFFYKLSNFFNMRMRPCHRRQYAFEGKTGIIAQAELIIFVAA